MENLQLIKLANNQQWEYGTNWLDVKNASQANLILSLFADDLSITASKVGSDFWVRWGETESDCISIPPELSERQSSAQTLLTMSIITIPGISIAPLKLSEPLLRLFLDEFLPNPSQQLTLIRRDTRQQVAVSEAVMTQVRRRGVTIEDLVKRTAWDYGFWPDLEQSSINTRLLTPNDSNSFIVSRTRMHDTTGQNWRMFTSELRLIEDPWGHIFHFGKGLDVEPCSMPVFYEEEN